MKLVLRSLAGLLVLAGSVAGQGAHPEALAPKLVVVATEFKAGEVKQGAEVKHAFTLRNEGKADLEIKRVVTTCGCETVDYDKTIAPGQEGKVTLLVRTLGLSGVLSKLIVVSTNDMSKPSVDLVMHITVVPDSKATPAGKIIGPFVISPSDEQTRMVSSGSAADFAVMIYSSGSPPAKITKLVSDGATFTFTLEPSADGARYVVRGSSPTNLAVGHYQQSVKLLTDNKETPELELRFGASLVLPLRISPTSVVFERVDTSSGEVPGASKFVWVLQQGGPSFEVKSIESSLPFLTAELQSNGTTGAFILRVKFKEVPPKGVHTGKIVVQTNVPAQPQFEIRTSVTVP